MAPPHPAGILGARASRVGPVDVLRAAAVAFPAAGLGIVDASPLGVAVGAGLAAEFGVGVGAALAEFVVVVGVGLTEVLGVRGLRPFL